MRCSLTSKELVTRETETGETVVAEDELSLEADAFLGEALIELKEKQLVRSPRWI
jgi:hypothetical protein